MCQPLTLDGQTRALKIRIFRSEVRFANEKNVQVVIHEIPHEVFHKILPHEIPHEKHFCQALITLSKNP